MENITCDINIILGGWE